MRYRKSAILQSLIFDNFFTNLDELLKSKNFTLNLFNSFLPSFRKRHRKVYVKEFFMFSAIDILKELHEVHHSVPNGPSIFLSIICDLDATNSIQSLYYLVAFIRCVQITLFEAIQLDVKETLIANSAVIYDKLLLGITKYMTEKTKQFAVQLKRKVYNFFSNKLSFIKTKFLVLDFFYFMLSCNEKIAIAHNCSLDNFKKGSNPVDMIYYNYFKELEDIYNAILLL